MKTNVLTAGDEFSVFISKEKLPYLYSSNENFLHYFNASYKLPKADPIKVISQEEKVKIIQVSAGESHSLCLSSKGNVYSCGYNNSFGQLGIPSFYSVSEDFKQIGFFPKNKIKIIQISARNNLSLFLSSKGNVYYCGYGLDLRGKYFHQPQPIIFLQEKKIKIIQISAGKKHTLFLSSENNVYSCGHGLTGQLGHGKKYELLRQPEQIKFFQEKKIKITQISAGNRHSLFLSSKGKVYSCGYNMFGQLGRGKFGPREQTNSVPKQIVVFFQKKEIKITQISAGENYSLFLSNENDVYSCGSGMFGQLGHGKKHKHLSHPEQIGFFRKKGIKIIETSAGKLHSLFATRKCLVYSCGSGKLTPEKIPDFTCLNPTRNQEKINDSKERFDYNINNYDSKPDIF